MIAIKITDLSKIYRLGEIGTGTLSLDLERWYRMKIRGQEDPFLKIGEANEQSTKGTSGVVYSLRDINLEIEQGDAMGIIGKNGAGKSTLLKIISRVTSPTTGKINLKGRVASLLEVGTGFHPDLTGRENIYLNGAILGMRTKEITRKFDEIVDFSGVERYIDTPVKRYSSGMYVRLAFAVAAHLESEILIVDEVLAVGDAEFQKKCLGKMGEVSKGEGRTVLFVSHNMGAVTRLCQHGVWIDQGSIRLIGDVVEVTNHYLNCWVGMSAERNWDNPLNAPGDDVVRLKSIRVITCERISDTVDIRDSISIEMEYWNNKQDAYLLSAFSFVNEQGQILFVSADFDERSWGDKAKPKGIFRSRCTVPGNLFAEGRISVVAEVSTKSPMYQIHFLEWDSVSFNIIEKGESGSVRANWGRNIPGVVRPYLEWQNEFLG